LAIRERALPRDHPDVGQPLNNLATLYEKQDRHADSEPLFKRSLAIHEKALGPEHPAVATLLNNLGQVDKAEGRTPDALPLFMARPQVIPSHMGKDDRQRTRAAARCPSGVIGRAAPTI
jgi:tetratricopeptide (TPR) repeat protein